MLLGLFESNYVCFKAGWMVFKSDEVDRKTYIKSKKKSIIKNY